LYKLKQKFLKCLLLQELSVPSVISSSPPNQLPGKICLQNDLLSVEWEIKTYQFTPA